ncbi:MAG: hypothetical protein BZY83_01145, partial [SAR202 cluster bacterium Casp-Chloro-G2]
MGWLSSIFRRSSKEESGRKRRGRRSASGSSEDQGRLDQDTGAEQVSTEAGPAAVAGSASSVQGSDAGDPSRVGPTGTSAVTPVTGEDVNQARELLRAGEFRASIEISLKRVQAALQQHQEAQALRGRSRSVFAQSESIMDEAVRSVEGAKNAYEQGFASNTPGNLEAASKVRLLDETLRSRRESNKSAYQEVLGQAMGMKESAIQHLIAALDSLNSAVMNVARELDESAKTASTADAAKESAIRELLAVQSMWNELASLRQDLLAQPDTEPAVEMPADLIERVMPPPGEAPQPSPAQTPPVLEEPYVLRQELSREEPHVVPGELADAAADLLIPGMSGQMIEEQVLRAADSAAASREAQQSAPPQVESLTGDPALDLEIANAEAAANFPGTPGASAAEALRREMAGLPPISEYPAPAMDRPTERTARPPEVPASISPERLLTTPIDTDEAAGSQPDAAADPFEATPEPAG